MHVKSCEKSSVRRLEIRSARGVDRCPRSGCVRVGSLGRGCIAVPPGCGSYLGKRSEISRGNNGDPPDSWNIGGRRGCTGDPPDSAACRDRAADVIHAQTDRIVRLGCTCVPPDSVTPRVVESGSHGCLD